MRYTRTPITDSAPCLLTEVKLAARVDHDDEDPLLGGLLATATAEIEEQAGLALMAQTITLDVDAWHYAVALPVGPFCHVAASEHPPTVTTTTADGQEIVHTEGWWIQHGMRPVLRMDKPLPGVSMRVTYPAGFSTNRLHMPLDLRRAVIDHAAMMYDLRGQDAKQGLSPMAQRIVARYRGIRL